MTPSLNMISARSMFVDGQPATIAARQTEFRSARAEKPALRTWRSPWRITALFEAFAGIFIVFYLLAATALAGALLFYTLNR